MVIFHGNDKNKEVALLFDDGPSPLVTPKLLKVLKDTRTPANFFLIGIRAEQSPEIVQQIIEAGHEIGNHTYTHKKLTEVLERHGAQSVLDEVLKGKLAIEKAANMSEDSITFLRPPYLDWSEELAKIVAPFYGDNIMMSGLAVGDWDWGFNHTWNEDDTSAINAQATRITDTWKQATKSGTLLGFHDSSEHTLPGNKQYDTWMNRALPTLEAIPHIIDFLNNSGYVIKKLSDMNLIREDFA